MESIEKNPEFIEMKSSVDDSIKMLLKENGFSEKDEFVKGIVSIIDLVADYHEEGIKYFPEIIISDDADNFNTPLTTTVSFSESEDKAEIAFKKALKLCVPLAINGWVIYIILGEHIDFGLISAEKKETSLPLKDQVFLDSSEQHFLYLSNSGSRSVEIFSKTKNLIINLSLENNPISTDLNLRRLVNAIISQVNNDGNKETIETFINKTIKEALNVSHGNLIAVCHENCFEKCLDCMSGGIKLKDPIDIPNLLLNDQNVNSNETSVAIKSKMSLVRSMINHDGIAFFSTNGKLLGFHYIIDNSKATKVKSVGGARTKAFEALKQNPNIVARFFKSQDGNTKFE